MKIEYQVQGTGEPLLMIHGSVLSNGLLPLIKEQQLTENFSVISYCRHDYGDADRDNIPRSIEEHVNDGRTLLAHLGISKANILGYSFGGAVAMQWAISAPNEIENLILIEPPLMNNIACSDLFWEEMEAANALFLEGKIVEIADIYFKEALGENYAELLEKLIQKNTLNVAIKDLSIFFQSELSALKEWKIPETSFEQITQRMLALVSENAAPYYAEGHSLLKSRIKTFEELLIPNSNHALPIQNPKAIVAGCLRFLLK